MLSNKILDKKYEHVIMSADKANDVLSLAGPLAIPPPQDGGSSAAPPATFSLVGKIAPPASKSLQSPMGPAGIVRTYILSLGPCFKSRAFFFYSPGTATA